VGVAESACDAGEVVALRVDIDSSPPIRECTPSRSRTNTLSKLRLARYSQQLMDELAAREGLQYWQTHAGVLYVFHEDADLHTAEHNSRLLAEHGRHQAVLDFDQIVALEPALGHGHTRFAGAMLDTSARRPGRRTTPGHRPDAVLADGP
jgi:glycine/D-amino acid oxidase-like deaminating enzyme